MLSPIEDILEDARAGRMFILVDDEDRENEGDIVIPAQTATTEVINFMAKYGRGLICLALDSARVRALGLAPMVRDNGSQYGTAFTASIEAATGVTSGISAADRARTIAVAIDGQAPRGAVVSPGHVFPLIARDGGVLVRAGHTEAAVDVARLAGLNPSGVICEIMNDDGSMARLPELIAFGKTHGLKIATIADLIAYRRRREKLVECIAETTLKSHFGGEFSLRIYANRIEYAEHVALVKGTISRTKPTLVRMHTLDVLHDVLGETEAAKATDLHSAMRRIGEEGSGVIVLLREPRRAALSERVRQREGEARLSQTGFRDYGIGAQILVDLGVGDMVLLSNSRRPVVGLDGYGLTIAGYEDMAE